MAGAGSPGRVCVAVAMMDDGLGMLSMELDENKKLDFEQ
jgi:hypothetical protein